MIGHFFRCMVTDPETEAASEKWLECTYSAELPFAFCVGMKVCVGAFDCDVISITYDPVIRRILVDIDPGIDLDDEDWRRESGIFIGAAKATGWQIDRDDK